MFARVRVCAYTRSMSHSIPELAGAYFLGSVLEFTPRSLPGQFININIPTPKKSGGVAVGPPAPAAGLPATAVASSATMAVASSATMAVTAKAMKMVWWKKARIRLIQLIGAFFAPRQKGDKAAMAFYKERGEAELAFYKAVLESCERRTLLTDYQFERHLGQYQYCDHRNKHLSHDPPCYVLWQGPVRLARWCSAIIGTRSTLAQALRDEQSNSSDRPTVKVALRFRK